MDKCWTCKLRKKRCDRAPGDSCHACAELGITCYRGEKPEWMDGAEKQAHMVSQVKDEVRINVRRRLVVADPVPQATVMPVDGRGTSTQSSIAAMGGLSDIVATPAVPPVPELIHAPPMQSSAEALLLSFFLDQVLPFLLPFYQPSFEDGGRAWVRRLIDTSPVYRQVALCQASMIYALSHGTEHNLTAQSESVFNMLRHAFVILADDAAEYLDGGVRILTSVVQLQRFPVGSQDHKTHLNAAISLFKSIVAMEARPSMPEWRFSTSLLLVDDIIAAAISNEQPRLYEHMEVLLNGQELEQIVGCHTLTMLMMGEAVALNAWKRQHDDVLELSARAARIQERLWSHRAGLREPPPDVFPCAVRASERHAAGMVWCNAALLYTGTVPSGRKRDTTTAALVKEIVGRLRTLPAMLLRAMLWPICIVCYVADEELRSEVESLLGSLPTLRLPAKMVDCLRCMWEDERPDDDLGSCLRSSGIYGFPV